MTADDEPGHITVLGRLDAVNGAAFLRMVRALVADGTRTVVVDLSSAEMSPAGVAVLANALHHVEQRDRELVVKPPGEHP